MTVWVQTGNANQANQTIADVNLQAKLSGKTVYSTTALIPTNVEQGLTGPNTDSEGIYNITATTSLGGKDQTAWITIKVTNLFNSTPIYFLYLSIGFLMGLVTLIIVGTRSHSVSEIIRFICITGIVFSILASLLLTDLQIGANSPVGLIIRNIASSNQSGNTFSDWALNIGGSQLSNFNDGISIPVYVVVFGIIGGYLRYLYKTARLRSINTPLREILLFQWERVPGEDSSILRNFLKERFDIDRIASQEFTKSSDQNVLTLSIGPDEAVTITLELMQTQL